MPEELVGGDINILYDDFSEEDLLEKFNLLCHCITVANGVISVATLLTVAVISLLIPKWRNFKNFVLTNMTISSVLYFVLTTYHNSWVQDKQNSRWLLQVQEWSLAILEVYHCWLFLTCLILYLDIEITIRGISKGTYVIVLILAWGVPYILKFERLIEASSANYLHAIDFMLENDIHLFHRVVLPKIFAIMHFVVFLRVMCCIYFKKNVSFHTIGRQIAVAAIIFIIGTVTVITDFLVRIFISTWLTNTYEDGWMILSIKIMSRSMQALCSIQMLLTNFAFVLLKSNRMLILTYFRSKNKEREMFLSFFYKYF